MQAHRFLGEGDGLTDLTPLVLAPRPVPTPGVVMVCPCFGVESGAWVQEVYRLAYEQAVAVSNPLGTSGCSWRRRIDGREVSGPSPRAAFDQRTATGGP